MVNIPKDELNNELEFIFQNSLENGVSEDEAFESVVDNLAERLASLNVPQEFIKECSKFVVDDYKEGLADGQTPIEAFNSAMENLHQNLEKEDFSKNNEELESNINLDFALTGDSPRLELMNEAMAKGLSVEDAIKYVNSKLNDNSDEFGPPTMAEFNKITENTSQTALGKENQEIDKIEATMDAEANKKIPDNTLSDKNVIDDNKILNESNLDKNDDEIS